MRQVEAAGNGVQSAPRPPIMHLAVVACGERLQEMLTMIKSAVLFSIGHLQLHIFAEDRLHANFTATVRIHAVQSSYCARFIFRAEHTVVSLLYVLQLESWPGFVRCKYNYTMYSISFPSENAAEWKKLFKPCASQRLFLPVSSL